METPDVFIKTFGNPTWQAYDQGPQGAAVWYATMNCLRYRLLLESQQTDTQSGLPKQNRKDRRKAKAMQRKRK